MTATATSARRTGAAVPPVQQRLSVTIVNWHSENLLRLSLLDLGRQTPVPDRVVIVDSGRSGQLPLNHYKRGPISVMRMARDEGFAAGSYRATGAATFTTSAVPPGATVTTTSIAAGRWPIEGSLLPVQPQRSTSAMRCLGSAASTRFFCYFEDVDLGFRMPWLTRCQPCRDT